MYLLSAGEEASTGSLSSPPAPTGREISASRLSNNTPYPSLAGPFSGPDFLRRNVKWPALAICRPLRDFPGIEARAGMNHL
jgi:hypothetical protein